MKPFSIAIISATLSVFLALKTYDFFAGVPLETPVLSEAETQAILKGADPTEILENTAAGSSNNQKDADCRFGEIIGKGEAENLDSSFYVSFDLDSQTFIQVSPLIPTYLVQPSGYLVSAKAIVPDDKIREQLNDYFNIRNSCASVDLYLENIER
ncbi:MAG: hypothetical protein ACPF9K_04245 [Neptuniibacter sp.]